MCFCVLCHVYNVFLTININLSYDTFAYFVYKAAIRMILTHLTHFTSKCFVYLHQTSYRICLFIHHELYILHSKLMFGMDGKYRQCNINFRFNDHVIIRFQ